MFNTSDEKHILAESLVQGNDQDKVVKSLDYILDNHTPFALYIATADRTNCMWVFDPSTVYDMLGGKDIHDKTFRSVFSEGWERDSGILFYVLRKVGPVVVIRFTENSIKDVKDIVLSEGNIP